MATILAVDDDGTYLLYLQTVLRDEGYTVLTAAEGALGIELYKKHLPDLLICDILLPPPDDGYEVMIAVRDINPGALILAISAGNANESWANPDVLLSTAAFFQKADGILQKPFSVDYLLAEVRRVLAKRSVTAQ